MGKVGECLANVISGSASPFILSWICSKHLSLLTKFDDNTVQIFNSISEISELPDAVIICTSDALIKQVAFDLANTFRDNLRGKFIIHTAGTYGKNILDDCYNYKAHIIAAHPFQTFYFNDINCLNNIAWGVECNTNLKGIIFNFIEQLNGKPYLLNKNALKHREFYHSVGVAASNYLATSIYFSKLLAKEIGISSNDFLLPIINQTVKNSLRNLDADTINFPITGPIVRSDFETLNKHLCSLNNDEVLLNTYLYLGLGLLEVSKINNLIDEINYCKTQQLFYSFLNVNDSMFKLFKQKNHNTIHKIVIGLGNPGVEYKDMRHNIGYSIAKKLTEKYNGKIEKIPRIANYSIIEINNKKILIVLPLTYMNKSGLAAKKFLDKYQVVPENLLIVVDEYNFPLGKIHVKASGGNGGHNGVESIIEELETTEFYRLRCGIDKNFGANELSDYVLSAFEANELVTVNEMIENSVLAIEFFIDNDAGKAMSYINSGKYLEQ